MSHILDNIVWHALSGPHAKYASGAREARRYAMGFPPIVGFADQERPDLAALADHCDLDEHLYCEGWSGPAPAGWHIDAEGMMLKMVWEAPVPCDEATDAIRLGPEHVGPASELAALANPGPFGPRTIELGECFGVLDGERLVAMAGERLHAGSFREISSVCTHPDYRGRGLARRLVSKLVHRQMQRGETPILHVMADNTVARGLYERMGFRDCRESICRIFSRC